MIVNKPVAHMRVRVTPEQFEAVQAAKQRLDAAAERGGPPLDGLVTLLVHCAMTNGGWYDADRHRAGGAVELVVIV